MRLAPLSEDEARAIARWRYPAPYDCYDCPAWDRMERDRWAICDAAARRDQFRALRRGDDEGDRAVGDDDGSGRPADPAGYVRFRPVGEAVAVHLGLHPALCGQGLGREFLQLVVAEARRRAGGAPVTLQVRRFNVRAATVYLRAGFRWTPDQPPFDPAGAEPEPDPQALVTMVLAPGDT